MTTITYNRAGKTGRPLGLLDVFSKAISTAVARFTLRNTEEPSEATLEAASVRRLADAYRRLSPGFSADLYAAADRHEIDASR